MMARPIALTLGEPAGIGPDITLIAYAARDALQLPPFYLIGDAAYLERRAQRLGLAITIAQVSPAEAIAAFERSLPVVPCGSVDAEPGTPNSANAPVVISAIRQGVADAMAGRAAALVTNPIAKSVLTRAGFAYPGHTEFLAAIAAEATGKPAQPVMMLWAPELAVVPVTVHLPLRAAIDALTTDLIVETCRTAARDLHDRFGIDRPRLALSGLNPHAGEQGTMGSEDDAIIAPAVAQLRAEGIDTRGPLPADTMFHAAARKTYDCAVCMYHDQALIPIKTLAFESAVNVTLGLPFIRTSPDHGTAFDIAGTGRANPSSLVAALRLAARLAGVAG